LHITNKKATALVLRAVAIDLRIIALAVPSCLSGVKKSTARIWSLPLKMVE
jgi:hypothetical protein